MSGAYASRLKSEMKPLFDQLSDLNEMDSLSDEQKADFNRITAELKAKKDDYDRAIERAGQASSWQSMMDTLEAPLPQPRAVYERSSFDTPKGGEIKAVSLYLTESREFKNPRNGHYNVKEDMPVAALYPFVERKAPYVPGNLELSSGARVIPPQLTTRFPLLELLRTVPWNELVVPYLPLVFTNNAAEVDIGAGKPESTNAGDLATVMMRTVAHWKEVPRQILRYIPGLRPIIDDELRNGVLSRMQNSVLNGSGTGTAMLGIIAQVTQTGAGDSLVPQIFDAIAQVENNGGTVDAILMNPADYAALLMQEYTDNHYNPLIAGERFGTYRIIRTGAITAGTALVGDFGQAVTLFVGEAANVQATEALGFKSNIVTIRGEMDAVVLVERPWLLVKCAGPLVDVTP